MAVFFLNVCKFNDCGMRFRTLSDLICHIEDTHIDYEKSADDVPRQALPMSCVQRFISADARKEQALSNAVMPVVELKRKHGTKNKSYSMSSSNRSNTPTVSEMDEDEIPATESEDSNDSWTNEEFTSEFIMRYGSRHSGLGANGTPGCEKPFACPVPGCKKRYKNVNGIKYHSKNGHKKDGGRVRKGYKCHCGKSYKTPQRLKSHSLSVHAATNENGLINAQPVTVTTVATGNTGINGRTQRGGSPSQSLGSMSPSSNMSSSTGSCVSGNVNLNGANGNAGAANTSVNSNGIQQQFTTNAVQQKQLQQQLFATVSQQHQQVSVVQVQSAVTAEGNGNGTCPNEFKNRVKPVGTMEDAEFCVSSAQQSLDQSGKANSGNGVQAPSINMDQNGINNNLSLLNNTNIGGASNGIMQQFVSVGVQQKQQQQPQLYTAIHQQQLQIPATVSGDLKLENNGFRKGNVKHRLIQLVAIENPNSTTSNIVGINSCSNRLTTTAASTSITGISSATSKILKLSSNSISNGNLENGNRSTQQSKLTLPNLVNLGILTPATSPNKNLQFLGQQQQHTLAHCNNNTRGNIIFIQEQSIASLVPPHLPKTHPQQNQPQNISAMSLNSPISDNQSTSSGSSPVQKPKTPPSNGLQSLSPATSLSSIESPQEHHQQFIANVTITATTAAMDEMSNTQIIAGGDNDVSDKVCSTEKISIDAPTVSAIDAAETQKLVDTSALCVAGLSSASPNMET